MIKLIAKHFRVKDYFSMLAIVAFVFLQVFLELKIPDFMSEITVLVQTQGSLITDILLAGGKMLACAVASALCAVLIGFFVARVASAFSQNMRSSLFSQIQSYSSKEIKAFSTASLITRTTNDITQIKRFLATGLSSLIKAPTMAVWAIIKILGKSFQWSVATAVAVVVLIVAVITIFAFVIPKFRKMQTLTDNLNRVTRENLVGLKVVRAYNAEKYQQDKFETANNELTDNSTSAHKIMSAMSPLMSAIMSFLPLSIYWIGAYLINSAHVVDKLTIFSDMVVFSSYAIQVVMSFVMLVMIFVMLPRASVAVKRVNEVLNTKSTILDGEGVSVEEKDKGTVEFRSVDFKYNNTDEKVLSNISFKVKKGETIAFIGSTGSGKSTLINLVPRFYDVEVGEVLVDGKNVKDYKLEDLRNRIGYVSQKAVLFSGTVASNIAFGSGKTEITPDDVNKAIKISQSDNFVKEMGEGVNSQISQGGKNVSGGQKQRLSIARALAKKPEILIFDDSFSALDYKTDKSLRQALKEEFADTTVLIVAQRIGTIKDADQIMVLEAGKVVGLGKHEELLNNCEVYKEIALSQLSEEELHG